MTDSYNRTIDYLRLSVTDRCNLRCISTACPAQGVPMGASCVTILRFEEIRAPGAGCSPVLGIRPRYA